MPTAVATLEAAAVEAAGLASATGAMGLAAEATTEELPSTRRLDRAAVLAPAAEGQAATQQQAATLLSAHQVATAVAAF